MEWSTVAYFAGGGFLFFFLFWYFFIDAEMTKEEFDRREKEEADATEAFTKSQASQYQNNKD